VAQSQSPRTDIGPHRIGETFREWLAASHQLDDFTAVCRSRKREDSDRCKQLSELWNESRDQVDTSDNDRDYKWKFIDGRLSQVTVIVPRVWHKPSTWPNTQEEITSLILKHGPAAKTEIITYQSGRGKIWDCLKLSWTTPDGTVIIASECMRDTHLDGPRRNTVHLMSLTRAEKLMR
jgi:hypothetical protein